MSAPRADQRQCPQLKVLRSMLRMVTAAEQAEILRQIQAHFAECEQCQTWWRDIWSRNSENKTGG